MHVRAITMTLLATLCLGLTQTAAPAQELQDPLDVLDGRNLVKPMIERFRTDSNVINRAYSTPMSPQRLARWKRFIKHWQDQLKMVDFDALPHPGQIDYLLFANLLAYEAKDIAHRQKRNDEIAMLVPFRETIVTLADDRQAMKTIQGRDAAVALTAIRDQIDDVSKLVNDGELEIPKIIANRAAGRIRDLRRSLDEWHSFYDGYDPTFSWWTKQPHEEVDGKLKTLATLITDELVGIDEDDLETIIGDPIGREALLDDLALAMIPYTPEELIEIAETMFAWCEREKLAAAKELGFEGDWKKAQEYVKNLNVEPGEQPDMIRELALEAIDFLEARELITIPDLAKEVWRMEMMTPRRQLMTPYFTGGEVISVSFPTDTMTHEQKMMSIRGNNRHFSRAVVHHELIPGHHLQGYMNQRHRTYRRAFYTPFWLEGWAVYWEMALWDLDFPETAEDKVGMLFWLSHRCARIIFSLSYHLELMSGEEAVDFLVDRVGHERRNAAAEVRRSVAGDYSPLYQAAYMLGALQFKALHQELVDSGRMTNREFHDTIMRNNAIPVELVRAILTNQSLSKDFRSSWRFFEDLD
ncbi:MAG: DUF885 family protein [Planctomycetota bacterium]|nr:DUF885 family protein [Planctomycetota bacterium]